MSRLILKISGSGGLSLSNLSQCLPLLPTKSYLFKSNRSLLDTRGHCPLPCCCACPRVAWLCLFCCNWLPVAPFLLSPGNTSSITSRPPTHHYIFLTSFLFWSTANWAQLFHCSGRGEFRAPTLLLCLPFLAVRARFTCNSWLTRSPCPFPCDYWQLGCITALGNPKLNAEFLLSCLCDAYLYGTLRQTLLF